MRAQPIACARTCPGTAKARGSFRPAGGRPSPVDSPSLAVQPLEDVSLIPANGAVSQTHAALRCDTLADPARPLLVAEEFNGDHLCTHEPTSREKVLICVPSHSVTAPDHQESGSPQLVPHLEYGDSCRGGGSLGHRARTAHFGQHDPAKGLAHMQTFFPKLLQEGELIPLAFITLDASFRARKCAGRHLPLG